MISRILIHFHNYQCTFLGYWCTFYLLSYTIWAEIRIIFFVVNSSTFNSLFEVIFHLSLPINSCFLLVSHPYLASDRIFHLTYVTFTNNPTCSQRIRLSKKLPTNFSPYISILDLHHQLFQVGTWNESLYFLSLILIINYRLKN